MADGEEAQVPASGEEEQQQQEPAAQDDELGAGGEQQDAALEEGAAPQEGEQGALELQQDPTAEELGPTELAQLETGGYQVGDDAAAAGADPQDPQQAPQPAEFDENGNPIAGSDPSQQAYAAGYDAYGNYDPNAAAAAQGYGDAAQAGYGDYGAGYGAYDPSTGVYVGGGEDAYGQQQQHGADGEGADRTTAASSASKRHGGQGKNEAAARALADQLLAEEREKHESQLKVEARAREELEDMILRIEKHFKAEQAARKKAEELLQASVAAEVDSKAKVEEVLKKRAQEQRLLEEERAAIKRERAALESMRQEFEGELQAARSEVAKAQEALASSEERIRAAEQVERARLEADYQARLGNMQREVDRMREELAYRTMVMSAEMEKWRQQAALTANAVLDAKNDVMERKKELDHTKDKMDRLLEKLYVGREHGIELSGAIASNQRMMSFMPTAMFAPGGKQPGTKLPPLQSRQHAQHGPGVFGPLFDAHAGALSLPLGGAPGSFLHHGAGLHSGPVDHHHAEGGLRRAHSSAVPRDVSPGQARSEASHASPEAHRPAGGRAAQSKFAQDAADKQQAARRAKSGRAANKGRPDRFAEAQKDLARMAGMGRRWN